LAQLLEVIGVAGACLAAQGGYNELAAFDLNAAGVRDTREIGVSRWLWYGTSFLEASHFPIRYDNIKREGRSFFGGEWKMAGCSPDVPLVVAGKLNSDARAAGRLHDAGWIRRGLLQDGTDRARQK
jgi:hypothetical protein